MLVRWLVGLEGVWSLFWLFLSILFYVVGLVVFLFVVVVLALQRSCWIVRGFSFCVVFRYHFGCIILICHSGNLSLLVMILYSAKFLLVWHWSDFLLLYVGVFYPMICSYICNDFQTKNPKMIQIEILNKIISRLIKLPSLIFLLKYFKNIP